MSPTYAGPLATAPEFSPRAQEFSDASGQIPPTAATVIKNGPGMLYSVTLNPGSAVSSLAVYDNASAASGKIIIALVAPANGASIVWTPPNPVIARNGLTIVVSGTAANAYVHFA